MEAVHIFIGRASPSDLTAGLTVISQESRNEALMELVELIHNQGSHFGAYNNWEITIREITGLKNNNQVYLPVDKIDKDILNCNRFNIEITESWDLEDFRETIYWLAGSLWRIMEKLHIYLARFWGKDNTIICQEAGKDKDTALRKIAKVLIDKGWDEVAVLDLDRIDLYELDMIVSEGKTYIDATIINDSGRYFVNDRFLGSMKSKEFIRSVYWLVESLWRNNGNIFNISG